VPGAGKPAHVLGRDFAAEEIARKGVRREYFISKAGGGMLDAYRAASAKSESVPA
jgi:hypothetical protein